MREVGAREDAVFDRRVWRIRCGDPDGKDEEEKKIVWMWKRYCNISPWSNIVSRVNSRVLSFRI